MRQIAELFRTRQTLLLCLVLTGVVFWTFLPAIDNGFVDYDDPDYVTANPHVNQGLSWAGTRWAFTHSRAANWHPLTWMSHQLDCELFGSGAWGHHLTSVILHAANAVVLFLVFSRFTGSAWRSFLVALFFAVHPLRVESVAWISERKDVLSGFFFLLTLGAYHRYAEIRSTGEPGTEDRRQRTEDRGQRTEDRGQTTDDRRQKTKDGGQPRMLSACRTNDGGQRTDEASFRNPQSAIRNPNTATLRHSHAPTLYYLLTLLTFILGLTSKPMLVTLPFVLLLLDFWPLERSKTEGWRSLILEKIPFLVAAIAISVVTVVVQKHGGAILQGLPLVSRIENAVVSYWRYVAKLLYPIDLAFFYPPVRNWPGLVVSGAALLLLATSLAAVFTRRRYPWFLVGWFWFLGTLVPVIGLVPAGEQSMADRYTYIPSIGFIWLMIWGIAEIAGNLSRRSLVKRPHAPGTSSIPYGASPFFLLFAGLLAAGSCLLTRAQIGVWRNDETLFAHAIEVTKSNYLAHNNLGSTRDRQQRFDEAVVEFEKALKDKPDYAQARNNLGIVLYEQNRLDDAIVQFHEALRIDPRYAEAHHSLGLAFEQKSLTEQALAEYVQAVTCKPEYPDAHYNLGLLLLHQTKIDEAIREFQKTLELQPASADAHNNLGFALQQKGNLAGAIAEYERAILLRPDYPRAHYNLGVALYTRGLVEPAIGEFREALKLKPDYVEARKNLDALLQGKSR